MAASPSPSPEDDQFAVGSLLDGRYRIDALLGSGGMGRVYRGEHTGIGRPVAIKVLHADLNRNREAAARFQREALASGRLDHPNIVGVSDFGVLDDGACYLVMEALEGESLGDLLQRDKRLPWIIALEVMRGLLSGLRHAHERGVVHRDIKPDNVFLARKDRDLVVKILDFGIAKLYAGSADDPASTRAGLTVGTPAYLSPEQAVGGDITPASDIYSSTIVLFEMLTGRAPFEDKDPLAMLGAHVSRDPPRLVDVAPDVEWPPGLEDLVARGLVKTAADRIASATEYIKWLDAINAAAPPPSAVGSAPVQIPDIASLPTDAMTPVAAKPAVVRATPPTGTGFTEMLDALDKPPVDRRATGRDSPTPVSPTPAPTSPTPAPASSPLAIRAISLADAPPIPRIWIVRGAIVLAVIAGIAILLAIVGRGGSKAADEPAPAKPAGGPPATVLHPELPKKDTADEHATKLKAALYELQSGKDCAARRAAIAKLVELDDPAAVPALKSARYRMRGGILGIGDENTNACLTKDAEAAIKKLTPKP